MSAPDPRASAALRMRQEGVTTRDIAASFGVAQSTVCRWTTPGYLEDSRERSRVWKDRNRERNRARDRSSARTAKGRGLCAGCGMPKGVGSHRRTHCWGCIQVTAVVRQSLTEGMWADGWTIREVGSALGLTCTTFMGVYRKRGWDLPHRRTPEQVARIREGSMRGRGLAA